jgi:hypothetical protein
MAARDVDGQQTSSGRWSWRLVGFAGLLLVGVWIAGTLASALDRASRTDVVAGLRPHGPIHSTADGRLVFVTGGTGPEVADGQAVAFDATSRTSVTLLAELRRPLAADLSPSGEACAITEQDGDRSSMLICSTGLTVNLDDYAIDNRAPFQAAVGARPADVDSDGRDGWYVSEATSASILHVDRGGTIAPVATSAAFLQASPIGLARDGDQIWYALAEHGFAGFQTGSPPFEIRGGQWVESGISMALTPSHSLVAPLVLMRERYGTQGWVTYQVAADAEHPRVVDGLISPQGLALLPDGRLAIVANDQLILYRPRSRP